MADDPKAPTHTAYVLKREGRRHARWLPAGRARVEPTGIIHVFLDLLPVGGFNGYTYLAPVGMPPPDPQPERPATDGGEEENF